MTIKPCRHSHGVYPYKIVLLRERTTLALDFIKSCQSWRSDAMYIFKLINQNVSLDNDTLILQLENGSQRHTSVTLYIRDHVP